MVAPHDTGDLVRSLVRVPGSGYNRTAGSVCFDLGRTSTLAATVPVSPVLPPALTGPRTAQSAGPSISQKHQLNASSKLGSNIGVNSGILKTGAAIPSSTVATSRKRPCPQEPSVENTSPVNAESSATGSRQPITMEGLLASKRARIVCLTPQQVAEHSRNIVQVSTPSGPMLFLPLPQQLLANTPVGLTPATIAQLLQERNNLRQENQVLQQQLSLFQQLFRNKERLTSVVKRLGVNVA